MSGVMNAGSSGMYIKKLIQIKLKEILFSNYNVNHDYEILLKKKTFFTNNYINIQFDYSFWTNFDQNITKF